MNAYIVIGENVFYKLSLKLPTVIEEETLRLVSFVCKEIFKFVRNRFRTLIIHRVGPGKSRTVIDDREHKATASGSKILRKNSQIPKEGYPRLLNREVTSVSFDALVDFSSTQTNSAVVWHAAQGLI